MGAIASQIAREARYTLNDHATAEAAAELDTNRRPDDALGTPLEAWARAADVPLVLLIHEIAAMVGYSPVPVLGPVNDPDDLKVRENRLNVAEPFLEIGRVLILEPLDHPREIGPIHRKSA